jgi:hypothetical protein
MHAFGAQNVIHAPSYRPGVLPAAQLLHINNNLILPMHKANNPIKH